MKILVSGGCGYVGTMLVEDLLEIGYEVVVVDNQWFGNYLTDHDKLTVYKQDIRDLDDQAFDKVNVLIHLANIANDPSVELNQSLSWEVNVLASQQLAELSIKNGLNQIIYASSGSVYGIKNEENVTEDLPLVPISTYNKTKMVAERVFLSYQDKIKVHCVRPATVCGWSKRMRLDVSVNMLTFQALKNKKITVFGGDQVRPNIHIDDLIRVYKHFLENIDIQSGPYNAGFENISILNLAQIINRKIDCEIIVSESNDPRSYRQNSDKLLQTGFSPTFSVDHAINDIKEKFETGELVDSEKWHTVEWMKKIKL